MFHSHLNYIFLTPWGFLDGANQVHPAICEVGVVLFLNYSQYFHIHYTSSRRTNMKVEFIALSTLLHFATLKRVNRLQVMGNLKVVIDWDNRKIQIKIVTLQHLLHQIQDFL